MQAMTSKVTNTSP